MGDFVKKLPRILSFAKPFWRLYVVSALFSGIGTLLGLAYPLISKTFFDDVLINKKFELFFYVLAAFLALYVISQAFGIVATLVTTRLSQRQQQHIKLVAYNHLQHLDLTFFYKQKVGDLLTRLNNDAFAVERFINTIVFTLFNGTLNLAIAVYISLRLDANVTLLALAAFPFYALSELYWVKRLKIYMKELLAKNADIFSFLQESISGIKATKIFTREPEMATEYAQKIAAYNELGYKNTLTNGVSNLVNGFILYLPTFTVLAFGGYKVLLGALTVGGLLAIQQYIGRLFGPLSSFISLNRSVQLDLTSINRLFEILDTPPEVRERSGAIELTRVFGRIEFDRVKFRYDEQPLVLDGVNGVIAPGKHIGLVGPSGIGKSTLVNLLFRFFDPTEGRILLDNIDVRDIKLKSLRSHIGFVSQESIVFNKSVKDNLLFGKPNAKMDDIIWAAKIAGIHDVIERLPKKYDTVLGERGETLSAGERQRLSIARVVLENPPIIILDEPTAALDAETERRLKDALDYVTKDKTTIVIAHRLSTLTNVDEIWVLNNGMITERGSFNELLRKKGDFFKYYTVQFGGVELFTSRLETELERAVNYQKALSVIELQITDWPQHDRDPLAGNALISDIIYEIASHLESIYFAAAMPQKRGSFLIALPEAEKSGAETVASSIHEAMVKKFPHLPQTFHIVFTTPSLTDEAHRALDALLKAEYGVALE